MTDERRILRPVTLPPAEAALAYMAVLSVQVPGARVKDAASLLAKCEAAMEAEAVVAGPSGEEQAD